MENRVGRIIGTREIIKNYCSDDDWEMSKMSIPNNKTDWVLCKCLNCGQIKPANYRTLMRNPPKRCSFCSNIGHRSEIPSNTNHYVVYDTYATITIYFNEKPCIVYIDIEDVEKCQSKKWRLSKKRNKFYVVAGNKYYNEMIYLHQFLIGKAPQGMEIDHIDGNSLNNRKSNLQYTTRSFNARETRVRIDSQIGIKGISYDKKAKKYQVDFVYLHNRFYTKPWKTIEEAVWCRYCLEEYFNSQILIRNPLFEQYNTLDDNTKEIIKKYVLSKINTEKSAV